MSIWLCQQCHSLQGFNKSMKCFACEGPLVRTDVVQQPVNEVPNTADWAARAASRIRSEMLVVSPPHQPTVVGLSPSEERIASIITSHAEPLVALLRETKEEHRNDEYFICDKELGKQKCTCGADAWNAKIDEVLK